MIKMKFPVLVSVYLKMYVLTSNHYFYVYFTSSIKNRLVSVSDVRYLLKQISAILFHNRLMLVWVCVPVLISRFQTPNISLIREFDIHSPLVVHGVLLSVTPRVGRFVFLSALGSRRK